MFRKKVFFGFLVFVILITFSLGLWIGKNQIVCEVCPAEDVNFSLFWEAYNRLKEKFVEPEKLGGQEMIYGAISGMVKSLGDPYTVFMPPQEAKKFLEDVSGRFEGVGMEIGIRNGNLQVIAPLEGTPAFRAGLRAGDKIIKVDDTLTTDITIDEAVNLIRGPKGMPVTLSILRKDWDSTKDFEIIRDVIKVPSLRWEVLEEDIAYIKIYHFTESATSDFNKIALEVLKSPTKKLILDLRSNPGGYLEVAQNIAGWFLEKGQVVAIEDFGGTKEPKEYKSFGNANLLVYPTVVLINQGTASGAEILAGALRDNRGVKIIGETSFGKGSVQQMEKLIEGSLKITIARWLTPNGEFITDKGLEPDIVIEMTDEDYEEDRDPQLDKALEIVKEID